jgi:hypothetical protein
MVGSPLLFFLLKGIAGISFELLVALPLSVAVGILSVPNLESLLLIASIGGIDPRAILDTSFGFDELFHLRLSILAIAIAGFIYLLPNIARAWAWTPCDDIPENKQNQIFEEMNKGKSDRVKTGLEIANIVAAGEYTGKGPLSNKAGAEFNGIAGKLPSFIAVLFILPAGILVYLVARALVVFLFEIRKNMRQRAWSLAMRAAHTS